MRIAALAAILFCVANCWEGAFLAFHFCFPYNCNGGSCLIIPEKGWGQSGRKIEAIWL